MTKPTIHQILERYWGYKRFRPQQEEIIQSILAGRDTLALMPTGGGKSLTYQVPTMAMEGICVVVTPLIALMKDQVDNLRRVGIKAVALHSGLSQQEIDRQMDNCVFGDVKFLYIAPERISSDIFRLRLEKMKLCLLAVDEAHCISQWGYDFRPAYLTISSIRKVHPEVPILALTASATKMVTEDIMQQLGFAVPHIIRSEFLRPNLSYSVRHVEDKYGQLMRICGGVPGCGIVYVRTRSLAEELAKQLTEDGISAAAYHGGMPHAERNLRQEEWLKNKTRIMVATNAFGMGIDKRDVRFVVHYSLCDSLEYYYQEAGRAGRDGAKAYAVLLTGEEDVQRISQTLEREFPPLEEIKTIYEELYTFLQIPIGGGKGQSRVFNIYDFCHRFHRYEGNVVCAIKLLELNGYMTLTDDHDNPARLMFMVERDELYRVRFKHEELDHFLRIVLRLYPGLFTHFRAIDELEIASWSGYTLERVKELLARLWQLRLVRYIPSNRSPMLVLHEERLPVKDLRIAPETYLRRKELMMDRLHLMAEYATSEECRSVVLDRYFGGTGDKPCGICDNCLERKRKEKRQPVLFNETHRTEALRRLEAGPCDLRTLSFSVPLSPEGLMALVESMKKAGEVEVDRFGFCKIRASETSDSEI